MLPLNRLCDLAHQNAVIKGFWDEEIPLKDIFIHVDEELHEAFIEYNIRKDPKEIYYKNDVPKGFPIEIADVIILIMSMCGRYGIDLEKAIETKMEYNKSRPYLHKEDKENG